MRSFRVLARMGAFADLALAVLAAGGAATCLQAFRAAGAGPARRAACVAALCVLILAENVPRLGTSFAGSSACLPPPRRVDAWLAAQPPSPLVELPLGKNEPARMWYQIRNQKPMLNGFGTFARPGFGEDMQRLKQPQAPAAIRRLQALGVRYVLIDAVPGNPVTLPPPYQLRYRDAAVSVFELPPGV
jgi:hypothetical protein